LENSEMKKSLVALAALAATTAFAQVTITGGVSQGFQRINGQQAVGGVDAVNSNSVIFTSTEDLGGGMKATGVFQMRLSPGAGSSGEPADIGKNGNRNNEAGDLYVDLSGGFGSVRAGKYTFLSHSGFNPFASRLVTSTATSAGVGAGGSNTVSYTTPAFSGVSVSLGATNYGNLYKGASSATGLKVNFAQGPLSVQAGVSTASVIAGNNAEPQKGTSFGASYNAGFATIYANSFSATAGDKISSDSTTHTDKANSAVSFGVAVPMGALTIKAGALKAKDDDTASSSVNRTSMGVDYALSKRTTLIAETAKDAQIKTTGAITQTNYFFGVAHTF
jgi:hypothetical protein